MDNFLSITDNVASLGHEPDITNSNKGMRIVAEELIRLIDFDRAQGFQSEKTIKTALDIPKRYREGHKEYYCKSFRLDFQSQDSDKTYEKYAIQCGSEYLLAQIHLKIGPIFGAQEIQQNFLESLAAKKEKWLPPKNEKK